MKNFLSAIAVILILTQGVYSQTEYKSKGDNIGLLVTSDAEQINNIDKITHEIKNNLKNYEKVEKFKDTTTFKIYYKENKEVQLISTYSTDQKQNLIYLKEWYFYNGQIIFSEQITTDVKSKIIIAKEQMYFQNQHLLSWVHSGLKVDPSSLEFKKADEELHDSIEKLKIENVK